MSMNRFNIVTLTLFIVILSCQGRRSQLNSINSWLNDNSKTRFNTIITKTTSKQKHNPAKENSKVSDPNKIHGQQPRLLNSDTNESRSQDDGLNKNPSTIGGEEKEASYYTEWNSNNGSCGFIPSDGRIVALPSQYMKESCNKCIEVSHGGKSIKLKVTDTCPSCINDKIDLSDTAFQELAPLSKGIIKINWKFVPC